MKTKCIRKWIAVLSALSLLIPILCVNTAKPVQAGESFPDCGANLSCYVTGSADQNTLFIKVKDRSITNNQIYSCTYVSGERDDYPWAEYRPFISKIVLDPGVTTIPAYAFADMPVLEEVCIPRSMKIIYTNAFKGSRRIDTLQYGGTEAEWLSLSSKNIGGGNDALLTHRGRNTFLQETVTIRLARTSDSIDLLETFGANPMYAIMRTLNAAEDIDYSVNSTADGWDLDQDGTTDIDASYPSGNGGGIEPIYFGLSSESTVRRVFTLTLSDEAVYSFEKDYNRCFMNKIIFDLSPAPPVEKIEIPSSIEIAADSWCDFHVKVLPKEAEQEWRLKIANTNIAKYVSVDQIIEGKQMGRTTVTVSTPDNKVKATCKIHVLFKDVTNKNLAAYDAIYWGADNDIVKGYKTYFDINGNVTRGQVVLFLWRAKGKPAPKSTTLKFKDAAAIESLAPDYKKAILWGSENGIVMGYTSGANAGCFLPNAPCTRGEIVTFLWRYGGKKPAKSGAKTFPDVPKTHKHYNAIMWASSYGIATGFSDGKFKPDQTCTRGQCVTFLYRMLK